jgi:hypothetical protein
MAPRKSQRDRRGRLRRRKGRMFPQGRPRPQPARPGQPRSHHHPLPPLIEPTARIHHFGEEAPVDPHIHQLNPHPYPRPLLGLSEADIAMIEADTLGLLG